MITLPETYPCPKCGDDAIALLYHYAPLRVAYSCHNPACRHKFAVKSVREKDPAGNVSVRGEVVQEGS